MTPAGFHRGGCCCIEEAAADCEHCDFTPKYWTVTFSGVTACSGCDDCGDGTSCKDYAISGVNAVHVLEQHEQYACVWRKRDFGSWSVDHYSGTVCGTLKMAASGTLEVSLTRLAGKWRLVVEAYPGHGFSPSYRAFWTEVDESQDDDCLNVAAMTNDFACGTCSDPVVSGEVNLASGGTATLEAGDQT